MEARRTAVGDRLVRWAESGEGQPVVLVHGIPTGPALWRHVVPRVDGARCLALEMAGYGASIPDAHGQDLSIARQAERLVAWLDELDIEQAVLVGHDLGGGVAQIVAVRHPERCAGLVLTNAIAYDSWPIPSVKVLRATSPVVRRLPNVAVKTGLGMLMARGHDDAGVARESFAHHWPHYAAHGAGAALARQVEALDVRDTLAVADGLPGLDASARVVWGAADQFQKVAYGERLARDLGTHLSRIEGGRHFTPEDHPDRIAAAVTAVLEDVRAAVG